VIAQDSGNRGDESRIAGVLCHIEATHGDPLGAFEYLAVAIRNYHDAGNSANLRPILSYLAAVLDRLGHYESAATIAGFAVVSPLAEVWSYEINRAITHLRDVLGDQTYEALTRKGEEMTTTAMATYAYDQIDQARAELNAVSKEGRHTTVSKIRVRIAGTDSLKSLTAEPAFDSFGDCLPSRLKHHHVAHVGEELGVSLVSPRHSRHLPVGSRTVLCCAKNKNRCGHRASIGKTNH
jgi:hypothetical protein